MSTVMFYRDRQLLGALIACAATLMILASQPSVAQANPNQKPTVATVKPKAVLRAELALIAKRQDWHKALINTPVPREGCFEAKYPRLGWQEVQCVKPPNIPMPPRHGALPYTVGNGNDYTAQVSGQLISVVGSFDSVTTTGERGRTYSSPTNEVADAYSLQINSNHVGSPPLCAGAAPGAPCKGWQQFVYSSKSYGTIFVQYWLLDFFNPCPAGWTPSGNHCYRNSLWATPVPLIPVASLAQTSLTASVVTVGGHYRVDLASGGNLYSFDTPDDFVSLANHWNTAEFAIVGDCCNYTANFDPNTSIAVRTTVHNGTTIAPTCNLSGFTGERNNLNLASTPVIGAQASPTVISNQTSSTGPPASCAVAAGLGDTHLRTFTPTPQVNAPASSLNYDFQAEGEFVLAKTDGGFEVQTRQISGKPMWPDAAVNQAIAAKIGDSVIVFSAANNKPQVIVNGLPTSLGDGEKRVLPNDGDLTRHQDTYTARDMHGNSVQVILQSAATNYLDVYVGLGRWPTNVQGLLANAKDNVNAVAASTGTVFPAPFNFATFYSEYGDSWRVKGDQSFFSAATRHLPDLRISNPAQPFDASHLAKATYLKAKTKCQRAGVKQQAMDDCILDVAVIGDKKAARSHIHPKFSFAAKRATIFAPEVVLPIRSNK